MAIPARTILPSFDVGLGVEGMLLLVDWVDSGSEADLDMLVSALGAVVSALGVVVSTLGADAVVDG